MVEGVEGEPCPLLFAHKDHSGGGQVLRSRSVYGNICSPCRYTVRTFFSVGFRTQQVSPCLSNHTDFDTCKSSSGRTTAGLHSITLSQPARPTDCCEDCSYHVIKSKHVEIRDYTRHLQNSQNVVTLEH